MTPQASDLAADLESLSHPSDRTAADAEHLQAVAFTPLALAAGALCGAGAAVAGASAAGNARSSCMMSAGGE